MNKSNSKALVYSLLLLVGLWCLPFSACKTTPKPDAKKFRAGEGGVYYGGIFNMNETEYFRTLYPLNVGEVVGHRITNQIYEGLVRLDQGDLTIQPSIAESWEIADDASKYTFKIRKGIKFHDDPCFEGGKGRELTAKDVKYCFDLLCSYDPNNKGYNFVKGRILGAEAQYAATQKGEQPEGGVEGVKVLDDNTLEVTLSQPFGSFLHILAMPFGFIFPKEAVDKYGIDMRAHTVGTGPFFLKRVSENEAVILLRNQNYWDKDQHGNTLPYLDGIRFSFIGDQMSEFLEFTKGKLDMTYRLPLEIADEIVDRSGNLKGEYKKYVYQEKPSMTTQYYGFLNSGDLFNNKKLRQAFSYAIDRQKIVDYTVKGAGVPAYHGIVPPAFANYDAKSIKGYDFNPEKARTLLKEAGHENGKGLEGLNLQINSGGKRNEQVAEAIQKMLEENLNVKVNITKMPFAQHLENVEAAKVDFWRAGWIADYPDPENFLTLLWSNHIPKDPKQNSYLNTSRYVGKEFNQYFEEALRTADEAKRNALYLKAEQAAVDDAPLLFLFYTKDQRLLQPNVRQYPQNAMEYRNLRDTYFEGEPAS